MHEIDIVKTLCSTYGIDLNEAMIITGLKNELSTVESKKTNNLFCEKSNDVKSNDVKPFDGIIKENCCKAVIYNHGLYTQCTNETTREYCSSVCKKLKYGHINVRKKYPVGSYVLENGKHEISYQKVKKRLTKKNSFQSNQERIITEDSDDDNEINKVSISKNPRGRPKMLAKEISINIDSCENNRNTFEDDDNIEEVFVRRQNINEKEYLVSEHNIVFDNKTYKMIGKLVLGKIVKNI
tara:strand:+ start:7309 stop:8025 length:717 start_codon:yes stop_codon:yes gene_type:complete